MFYEFTNKSYLVSQPLIKASSLSSNAQLFFLARWNLQHAKLASNTNQALPKSLSTAYSNSSKNTKWRIFLFSIRVIFSPTPTLDPFRLFHDALNFCETVWWKITFSKEPPGQSRNILHHSSLMSHQIKVFFKLSLPKLPLPTFTHILVSHITSLYFFNSLSKQPNLIFGQHLQHKNEIVKVLHCHCIREVYLRVASQPGDDKMYKHVLTNLNTSIDQFIEAHLKRFPPLHKYLRTPTCFQKIINCALVHSPKCCWLQLLTKKFCFEIWKTTVKPFPMPEWAAKTTYWLS